MNVVALALFVGVCLAGLAGRAAVRALWHDELFTLYLSQLPDLATLWTALRAGVDLNPPLSYIATRAALVFGDGLIAVRLPSLAGFGAAAMLLFAIVSRPAGRLAGWLAVVLFVSTQAANYAYEARPYALALGLAAAAVAAWQRTPQHWGWRIALTASLALLVSTHYVSVLLFVPLTVAEAVRGWESRRLHLTTWAALAAGAAPLLAWLPLMRAARGFAQQFWARPELEAMLDACIWLAGNVALPLMVLIGTAGAAFALSSSLEAERDAEPRATTPTRAEWALMVTLAATPVLALLLGRLVTGTFVARYTLPSLIGWCALAAWLTAEGTRTPRARRALAVGVCAAGAWTGVTHALAARQLAGAPPPFARPILRAAPAQPQTIVVSDVRVFLPLAHDAPPPVRQRVLYPGKPERAAAISRGNTGSEALQRLRRLVPLRSEPLDTLIGRREPVLVYGPPTWVQTLLIDSGASLRLLGTEATGDVLLLAQWPKLD